MRILAMDCAASSCSVAVWDDGVVHERLLSMSRGHAEVLLPMVIDAMREANRTFAELDLLAVTVGPGAFTGLRVGVAAARGLALASGLPCIGITTFEAVAAATDWEAVADRPVLVVLDTRRDDVYAQLFSAGKAAAPPFVAPVEALAGRFGGSSLSVSGDVAGQVADELRRRGLQVEEAPGGRLRAAAVAHVAARRWRTGETPSSPPQPLYLREAQTGPCERGRMQP